MVIQFFVFGSLSKFCAIFATLEATRISVFALTVINGNCFVVEEKNNKMVERKKKESQREWEKKRRRAKIGGSYFFKHLENIYNVI